MTESRPPGPLPQLLSIQSPHKRFLKGLAFKNPFSGGTIYKKQMTDCVPDYILALDGDLKPTG